MENTEVKKTFRTKVKEAIIVSCVVLIAIGDLGGFRDIVVEGYENVISNFTHKYEYQQINEIHLGSNVAYLENTLGEPQLIKPAKYVDNVRFNYYLNDKYILALFVNDNRVVGYSVTALQADFKPYSLSEKATVVDDNLSNYVDSANEVGVDINNVSYLVMGQQLGKEKLFNTYATGIVDYSQTLLDRKKLSEAYVAQNEGEISNKSLIQLASNKSANFYALTEQDISLVNDSILTLREYQFYY